uniref:Uncharacterized protein n=1 Tax=viral metagenome TaxID=1070528 RepID=A0A6C0CKK5_9ZZZZ
MLKIGGGRDQEEAKLDPDMVVLGSHAGFMKGKDWDKKSYWNKVKKTFDKNKYKFTLIIVDEGSESWLRSDAAKIGVNMVIREYLDHDYGTIIMAADERSRPLFDNIESEHKHFECVASVRKDPNDSIGDMFKRFVLVRTHIPLFILEDHVFPFTDYAEITMSIDYKFSPRFNSPKKRKDYWDNNFKSLQEFYNWISLSALKYRVMTDDF